MIALISIYTGGILTLLVATFHVRFSELFKWKSDFRSVSVLNKKISHTIHLALLLIFYLFGLLSLIYARELSECNGISFGLNLMISAFWLWRTAWQIYYFKGKAMHYALIAIFSLLFIAYSVPLIFKLI
jgi:hypothetical protein